MKFGTVRLDKAVGAILAHKLLNSGGRKMFSKGHCLTESDIATLREAGHESVVVAQLAGTDLDENEAARRVAGAITGEGVRIRASGVGRANILSEHFGPLRLNVPALERINNIDAGITVATLREHTLVKPRELVALVKVIPFGVAEASVAGIEHKAAEYGTVVDVRPMRACTVSLIVSGPENARERLLGEFHPPVKTRIEGLGSKLLPPVYVAHDPDALCDAINSRHDTDLIIVGGISAIIDRQDVIPTALEKAGGHVTHFGVPVDPGSLLMLGYLGEVPVMGAPGCIKSLKTNVIDMLLPRLLAGERLTRADLVALGHGGLLEDISERPMPRD